jgi:hypothetical protein
VTASIVPYSTPWCPGMVISEPGIYSRVPMHHYHSARLCDGPSISSSGLRKLINESCAHYWCSSPYNPDRIIEEESEAMILGRAAHHLLLGEAEFVTEYAVRPESIGGKPWQGNRTECRAWLSEQKANGRTPLKPDHIDAVRGMARSLAAHPLIKAGLLNGAIEQTMVSRCRETGYWQKVRPDAVPNDSGDFADLKTCASVQTHALRSAIAERGYVQQGALTCKIWHDLTGSADSTFTLVFVEKTPPYCVRVVTLLDQDLARGEQLNDMAMRLFAHGMTTGEWPGPGGADAEYTSLPEWAQKQIDYQLEQSEKEAA